MIKIVYIYFLLKQKELLLTTKVTSVRVPSIKKLFDRYGRFWFQQIETEGEITLKKCKQIYEVIKDYDDNILYGYCGRTDCAKFKDFKEIVKDCIENKCKMKWS